MELEPIMLREIRQTQEVSTAHFSLCVGFTFRGCVSGGGGGRGHESSQDSMRKKKETINRRGRTK